jgi:hypothetical protein
MRIVIDFIPHQAQRYDTLGDWFIDTSPTKEQFLHINVSQLGQEMSELAIAVHEIVEAVICLQDGITDEMVDQFDFAFDAGQKAGQIWPNEEPGDSPDAPYYEQHQLATRIEREVVASVGMSWREHEQNCAKVLVP